MKLHLFGCSQTETMYWNSLKDNKSIELHASGGNSNMKILQDVYEYVTSDLFDKTNDILIIQYTYTNRWWIKNNFINNEASFHSMDLEAPIYRNVSSTIKKELLKFYELYIKYFWDYDTAMETLLMEIHKTKVFLDSLGIKYIQYLWAEGGNSIEWNRFTSKTKGEMYTEHRLKKLGCETIEGYYFGEEWGFAINETDDGNHLTKAGCDRLSKILLSIIDEKFFKFI